MRRRKVPVQHWVLLSGRQAAATVWRGTRPVYRTQKQAKANRQLRNDVLTVAVLVLAWVAISVINVLAV